MNRRANYPLTAARIRHDKDKMQQEFKKKLVVVAFVTLGFMLSTSNQSFAGINKVPSSGPGT
jgi:hypothetical protein